ncbi:universal stress protein [Maribius pontilimi]|uniref:Universal stress protein n=1 Tax=Palleronia pontilimi TaxID=1964209 RepID=A0A934MEJ4_9RHOB|nr:universal stress protein [Palleronia pontilimi]MBJ3764595.1 universal stress protein [Palleronia pontilimi]
MQVNTVLLTVDVSADHDRTELFSEAARLGETGARIVVLTVVPEMYLATATDPTGTVAKMEEHAKAQLESVIAKSQLAGSETRVGYGPVAGVILDVAEEIGADKILIHARRPGPASYALGSVASRVANHAKASVLVIRDR